MNSSTSADPLARDDVAPQDVPGRMDIDATALRENFRALRKRAGPERKLIAVVKADGYGHGAVGVAKSLAGESVDLFAAGGLAEAVAVAAVAGQTPVMFLGSLQVAESRHVIEHGVIPSIDTPESARALSEATGERPTTVFVKIDGGFGRFGVSLSEAADFIRWLSGLRGLSVGGIYTHLPFSDEAGRVWAIRQGQAFDEVIATLSAEGIDIPVVQSVASPGVAADLHDRGNAIAVGHLLYGMAPLADGMPCDISSYWPALLAVSTALIHLGHRLPGDEASLYLRATPPEARLGVIPVGIHHGYHPSGPRAHVLLGGVRVPVLRPCLENTVLDLSAAPKAAVGDEVILVGGAGDVQIKLAELADWQAASPLAILTGLGRSLYRQYVTPATD